MMMTDVVREDLSSKRHHWVCLGPAVSAGDLGGAREEEEGKTEFRWRGNENAEAAAVAAAESRRLQGSACRWE